MRNGLLLLLFLIHVFQSASGQTKKELEEQRRITLEEIAYVDNMLKETEKEKREGMNELNMIRSKLNLRESVLRGLQDEIGLLTGRIDLNNIAIEMMEADLKSLKKNYEKGILNSYRLSKGSSQVGYILSAKDFNQGYKRARYLEQVTKFRRQESEIILELKSEIEDSKKRMEEDLNRISELKMREEQQKSLLQNEQKRQSNVVRNLSSKEAQLKRELEEKKRIAKRIEGEIARIIDEERKRGAVSDLTPEQRLIGESFQENMGRLPWPVERGVITSRFGIQKHPVLKYVTENNIDIEITCSGLTTVRSVFKGEVSSIISIRGANMSVIIRHGKYFTVYQNLVNVKVRQGEKVDTKQEIGRVFSDPDKGDQSVLKFAIFEEKAKLDPELWISKKN